MWIARILVSWGLRHLCCRFWLGSFGRFLLGIAETGFFEDHHVLTYWFRQRELARQSAFS